MTNQPNDPGKRAVDGAIVVVLCFVVVILGFWVVSQYQHRNDAYDGVMLGYDPDRPRGTGPLPAPPAP